MVFQQVFHGDDRLKKRAVRSRWWVAGGRVALVWMFNVYKLFKSSLLVVKRLFFLPVANLVQPGFPDEPVRDRECWCSNSGR